MIKQILPLVAAICVAPCFAGEGWVTDMDAAKKQAAEQKKDLLIEFTGSDWCGPCIQMRANVLTKEDFIKEAQKNFVLVELDYPQRKAQPANIKAANGKLAELYKIRGFPTIVFAFPDGKPYGSFVGGRAREAVESEMQKAMQNKAAIQAAMNKAGEAKTDEAKIEALLEVLKLAPEEFVDNLYEDVKLEIVKLDKNDKLGMKAATEGAARLKKEKADYSAYFKDKLSPKTPPAEMLKLIKKYPNRDKLLPEIQQDLLMLEFDAVLQSTGDVDGAVLVLDKAAALGPDTKIGKRAADMKKSVLENKERIKSKIEAAKKARSM